MNEEGRFTGIYGLVEATDGPLNGVCIQGKHVETPPGRVHLSPCWISRWYAWASGSKGGPPTPHLAHLSRFTRPGQSPDLAGARAISYTQRLNEPYN